MIDIESIIDNVIAQDLSPDIFNKVDDRDLPLASNIAEFCFEKKFLGTTPYPKQLEIMLKFFGDFCYSCSNMPYVNEGFHRQAIPEILDNIQLLEQGKCPKCGQTRYDFYQNNLWTFPNELVACAGQRTGKSACTTMIASYVLHRYLKTPNPAQYFNLLAGSPLHGTFTALTFDQACDTLFEPFQSLLSNSQWYQDYHDLLKHYEKTLPNLNGKIFKMNETFVNYQHKNITIYPKGPDKGKMRGRSRFLTAVDEIGWLTGDSGNVKTDADEIEKALVRSLTTVRTHADWRFHELKDFNTLNGYSINISSPSHANDKIMRLVREGRNNPKKSVWHFPTWEGHPKITRASLEAEFRTDPVAAERDYGANPPISDNPYFSNHDLIKSCFDNNRNQNSIITVKEEQGESWGDQKYLYYKASLHASDKTTPYVLAIDAGHVNNSFAIVVSHYEDNKIIHDILIDIVPHDDLVINFSKIQKHVINPLIESLNVKMVVADRWNSIKVLQDIGEDFKFVKTEQYSCKWEDFEIYKNKINKQEIILPKPEKAIDSLFNISESYEKFVMGKPVLHMALQLFTVQQSGRQIVKGPGGLTDDLFRASVLGSHFLLSDKHPELRMKGSLGRKQKSTGSFLTKSMGPKGNLGKATRIGGIAKRN